MVLAGMASIEYYSTHQYSSTLPKPYCRVVVVTTSRLKTDRPGIKNVMKQWTGDCQMRSEPKKKKKWAHAMPSTLSC